MDAKLNLNNFIAIDPGPENCGYCMFNDGRPIDWGNIGVEDMLTMIEESDIITHETPIVIEMITSYGMKVGQTTFDTCVVIGRIQELANRMGYTHVKIPRRVVRSTLKKKNDKEIRAFCIEKYGEFGASGHSWQACGLGITFMEIYSESGLKKGRKIK